MARTSAKNKADDARKIAEAQAAKDAELMASLQKRDEEQKKAAPPSLGDNFISVAAMIKQAKFDTRLSEQTLIKAWELTLMWELNTRNNPQRPPVFDPREIEGEFTEVPPEAPAEGPTTADEMIGESTSDTPEENV